MLGLEGADVHLLRYRRRVDQTSIKISGGGGGRKLKKKKKKKLAELGHHARMSGVVVLTEGLKF